jgi:hypothetical protein
MGLLCSHFRRNETRPSKSRRDRPDDGDSNHFRNVSQFLSDYTTQHDQTKRCNTTEDNNLLARRYTNLKPHAIYSLLYWSLCDRPTTVSNSLEYILSLYYRMQFIFIFMIKRALVSTARRVLRLQTQETASRCGGYAQSKVRRCLRHNLCRQPYGIKSLVRSTGSAVWSF